MPPARQQPRVGLVLGAGGVLGGAWLVGALEAIAAETGWDPGSAERIVGTSAGAMIGALLACGVPPWFMVAHSSGEDLGDLIASHGPDPDKVDRSAGAVYRFAGSLPSLGPGSWKLALGSLARPYRHSPASFVSAWLPRGFISTEPLRQTVRQALGPDRTWAPHPGYRAVACDYQTGEAVAFGEPDAPQAHMADAVAASCAIPGFYHPVEISGRRYIDGGIRSTSNLDLLLGDRLDLIVCLNPMSSLHAASPRTLGERVAWGMRGAAGRRLGSEARRIRAAGIDLVLIQPTVHDLDAMGTNLMSSRRRHDVVERGVESVSEHLRESGIGADLAKKLPKGTPALVRRPRRGATPDLRALAAQRFTARNKPKRGQARSRRRAA